MKEYCKIIRILAIAFIFFNSMSFGSIVLSQLAKQPNEIARDGRFIAYENDTVLDTETHLLWAANDDGKGMDKQNAVTYFENFRGGGYTDWRMPSVEELESLYDQSIQNKFGFHVTRLIDISGEWVWCSERQENVTSFNFKNGTTPLAFFEGPGSGTWYSNKEPRLASIRALPVRYVGEKEKKKIAMHLSNNKEAEGIVKPAHPTEGLKSNITIEIAVFPWRVNILTRQWSTLLETEPMAIDGFNQILEEYKSIVLKYSYYAFSNAEKGKDKPLTEDFYNDIWVKKGFFFQRELNLELIIKLGRQLNVDAVLLYSFDMSGSKQTSGIILTDIETGKVYSRKDNPYPYTLSADIKYYTEHFFINYLNDKYGTHPNYEMIYWNFIKNSQTIDIFDKYINIFPNGTYTSTAKDRIASISKDKSYKARSK